MKVPTVGSIQPRHWRQCSPEFAVPWQEILAYAQRGLIHGMNAHEILSAPRRARGINWSPADTANFLRDMVETGALVPIRKDLAGAGVSVVAFRGLQYPREPKSEEFPDVDRWLNGCPSDAADAHLWIFSLPGLVHLNKRLLCTTCGEPRQFIANPKCEKCAVPKRKRTGCPTCHGDGRPQGCPFCGEK